ncbi:MAG: ferritin-like domain-containing protein [Myxococcota bacterium]|nr:ferritin-like domain-containing protein [Myxococcota bacterium]
MIKKAIQNSLRNLGTVQDATRVSNFRVLASLLSPALRGFILQKGKGTLATELPSNVTTHFNWEYGSDQAELAKLYSKAKKSQWNAETDIDWSVEVDPESPSAELVNEAINPLSDMRPYRRLPPKEQRKHRAAMMSWMLSQFLHGEQGALYAACHVTSSVQWMDGKLYGASQVVDEGRHVEVFQRYLIDKLGKVYEINDNLYVILDALMTDSRWDIKFLGMQIMVEGLALGAFGVIRHNTQEPLLKELLRYVITDEARHVHYGVVALESYYTSGLPEHELREREDWAFEMSVLLRNRFLAHEFYDEYYGHALSRKEWERTLLNSDFMREFRFSMFRRIIPNLKRINLLSERIRPHYGKLGLLEWERQKAAPELSVDELLAPA